MKKIIVCPDSFKGSLTAFEVTKTITDSIKELSDDIEVVPIPLADGGEGTASILSKYGYENKVKLATVDALGHPIEASYLISSDGKGAFIESASALGIALLNPKDLNPLIASSYGLGLIVKDAVEMGCKEITISLGGSATCDGGMGMLDALGYRFFDSLGQPLKGNGKNLIKISKIVSPSDNYNLVNPDNLKFTTACDVKNPLYGPNGASYVFAPQKGAKPQDLPFLEMGLRNLARHRNHGDFHLKNGAGAAGGIGFAMFAFLNSNYVSGIDFILQKIGFEDRIVDSDILITGEGKIDHQSLMGKVLEGVLEVANKHKIEVIALAGKVEDEKLILKSGVKSIYEIADPRLSLEENLLPQNAKANLRKAIRKIFGN